MTDLKDLQNEIHQNSVDHGFWEASTNIGEKIALIHSELSEALEDYRDGEMSLRQVPEEAVLSPEVDLAYRVEERDGVLYPVLVDDRQPLHFKPEGFPIELADAVIRILDLAAYLGIDLGAMIDLKVAFNKTRPHLHNRRV